MKSIVVPVKNVARLQTMCDDLMNRPNGVPGMGLVYGRTGLGKTTATTWYVIRKRAVLVRALALWSPQTMLATILRELEAGASGSLSNMVDAVIESLRESNRPLFIDEADYVLDSTRMLDTLRDIHDYSSVPVVLIGMDGIKRKLDVRHRKQTIGRIARWVEFLPTDIADAMLVRTELVEHTRIDDELTKRLHERSGGSMRRIIVGLHNIESYARRKGLKEIGIEDWPKNMPFFLGGPDEEGGA